MNESGLLEYCRVCAGVAKHAIDIFSSEGQQRRLVEKIENVLPITVSKDDRLPLRVCVSCEAALEASQQLWELSLRANQTLSDLLEQQETSQGYPKLEPAGQDSPTACESPVEEKLSAQSEMEVSTSSQIPAKPSSTLQCQLCSQVRPSPQLLREHYQEDHHCYMCIYCCQWFALASDTKIHINQVHKVQCKFCKKRIIAENMEWHHRNAHKKLAPKCIPATTGRAYNENIECNICEGKVLGNKYAAKMHYFWEHDQHACDVCLELFSSSEVQLQHTEEVHMIPCSFCNEKFYTSIKFKRHVNQDHKEQSSQIVPPVKSKSDVFECKTCKKGVSSKLFLKRHNFWSHGTITCDFCLLEFRTPALEEQHFREAHSSVCDLCNEEVSGDFSEHLQASHAHEQPFFCESCGQAFCSREQLAEHRKEHEVKRAFLCDLCGKSFRLRPLLILHNKFKHTNKSDSKVTCEICSKNFIFESQLKKHMLQHTKSKQFKCLDCQKCFLNAVCLKRHMNYHTGNKRHQCNLCDAKFERKGNLRSHIKTMHCSQEMFKCCICDQCFDVEQDAYLHATVHSENHVTFVSVGTFQCELCDDRFSCRDTLKAHLQRHTRKKKSQQ